VSTVFILLGIVILFCDVCMMGATVVNGQMSAGGFALTLFVLMGVVAIQPWSNEGVLQAVS